MLSSLSNVEIARRLAERLREARGQAGLSRRALAERAGVSAHTLRRFEDTGQVALPTLVALMRGLGRLDDLDAILAAPEVSPLELLRQRRGEASGAKRGRRRDG